MAAHQGDNHDTNLLISNRKAHDPDHNSSNHDAAEEESHRHRRFTLNVCSIVLCQLSASIGIMIMLPIVLSSYHDHPPHMLSINQTVLLLCMVWLISIVMLAVSLRSQAVRDEMLMMSSNNRHPPLQLCMLMFGLFFLTISDVALIAVIAASNSPISHITILHALIIAFSMVLALTISAALHHESSTNVAAALISAFISIGFLQTMFHDVDVVIPSNLALLFFACIKHPITKYCKPHSDEQILCIIEMYTEIVGISVAAYMAAGFAFTAMWPSVLLICLVVGHLIYLPREEDTNYSLSQTLL